MTARGANPWIALGCAALLGLALSAGLIGTGVAKWARAERARAAELGPFPVREARRTLVLIAIDDLRRDHLAPAGYRLDPAPELTRLAERGVLVADYVPASVAVSPGLATLLTGLSPWEHGLASARELGAHRLSSAVDTIAERLKRAGWSTLGAVSSPELAYRLSALDQGFDVWHEASTGLGPLAAAETVASLLPELEAELRGERNAFVFVHFADLREPGAAAEDAAEFLRAHLEPFRAEEPDVDAALSRLDVDPAGAIELLMRDLGRRRGSAKWLAFLNALYDAALAGVDDAVGELRSALERHGREDATFVVAGTRGHYLDEARPPEGAPEPFSEVLLGTPAILAGPGATEAATDAVAIAELLLDRALRAPASRPERCARVVAGPGLLEYAVVGEERKLLGRVGDPLAARVFLRADDSEVGEADDGLAACVPPALRDGFGWDFLVDGVSRGELRIRARAPSREIVAARVEGGERTLSPSGASAEARWDSGGALALVTTRRTSEVALEVTLEPPAAFGAPKATTRSNAFVAGAAPVFPAAPREDGDYAARVTRDGAWARVEIETPDQSAEVRVALWAYPPAGAPDAIELEPERNVSAARSLAGLGVAFVEGRGDLAFRARLRAGQDPALAATIAGEALAPSRMAADGGGDGESLSLLLPPFDLDGVAITAAEGRGGAALMRRRSFGPPLDPPLELTEQELRTLLRLGPLE